MIVVRSSVIRDPEEVFVTLVSLANAGEVARAKVTAERNFDLFALIELLSDALRMHEAHVVDDAGMRLCEVFGRLLQLVAVQLVRHLLRLLLFGPRFARLAAFSLFLVRLNDRLPRLAGLLRFFLLVVLHVEDGLLELWQRFAGLDDIAGPVGEIARVALLTLGI